MKYIRIIFATWSTFLIYILGGHDIALDCLFVAVILDYITGVSKSFVNENLSSSKGFKGAIKKFNIFCLVALSVIIDKILGSTGAFRTLIIYYITANEGLSIIENLGAMDIVVPDFLKKKLEQIKDNNSKDNREELKK